MYSNEGRHYTQVNFGYRYSRWQYNIDDKTLHPLQMGIFTTRTLDYKAYFLESPSQYPEKNYYDETRLRWGFEFGSALTFWSTRFELAYLVRIIDSGLVAVLNNSNKDLQYYISSGVSLRYRFE
ncbi:MAG: hypothetical protein JNL11_14795 [Bdellovibrionaceae bacterium]|nr:hypothetical protein [Pseudobdellovibrionaceae bacterium]